MNERPEEISKGERGREEGSGGSGEGEGNGEIIRAARDEGKRDERKRARTRERTEPGGKGGTRGLVALLVLLVLLALRRRTPLGPRCPSWTRGPLREITAKI
jgi:MYXO-CTERM domain-containing protein